MANVIIHPSELETTLGKQVLRRHKQLEEDRQVWLDHWTQIAMYVVPRRFNMTLQETHRVKVGQDIYDGTPIGALNLLADGLHGYLVSPSIQWFKLMFRNKLLNDNWEVKEWLQNCAEEMYGEFANSNFYEAMSEYFLDGGSIGTATIYIEEDRDRGRLVFSCRHPGEIYIAENKFGNVDTVYRRFFIEARQAEQKWGFDALSEQMQIAAQQTPQMKFEIVHAVFPREDRDITKLNNKNFPLASVYVEVGKQHQLSESGYRMNPYAVWRWRKNSNEVYGRSPASDALVDIIKLNQMSKDLLIAAHKHVAPPLNVPQEMKGKVRIEPDGLNYYAGDNRTISPVNIGSNFPVGIDREERVQKIIEDHFKVDFFLMLARAEREMTATEVLEKSGEKAAVLGTTIGRLNSEALNPLIDRVFDILYRAGKLPEPPEIVLEESDGRIEVDYLGPLAQAQRRFFRTQGIVAAFERAAPIIQIAPDVVDIIDTDKSMREVLDAAGAPAGTIRSEEAVAAIREARAQAAQRAAQQEEMAQTAGVVKQVAQADKLTDGSIRDQLAQASEELP